MLRALITGVCGQDGSFLAEYLLEKGYKVYGLSRRKSTSILHSKANILNILNNDNFTYIEGDLTDPVLFTRIIHDIKPHEVYNLGAMSHVGYSFKNPVDSFRTNAESVVMHLSMIKDYAPSTRYYQASTSEMLGGVNCPKEGYNESFLFDPRSPYAIAKVAAHLSVKNYREAYGLFCCAGILFNHSSTRRGEDFATRKITKGIAECKAGKRKNLKMGNLSAFRDEGCSKDYVVAMNLMLKNSKPKDYVISTGEGATIEQMFKYVCGIAELNFEEVYELDERFLRPSDVPYLLGDSTLARNELGWVPKYNWKKLLKEMYEYDLRNIL